MLKKYTNKKPLNHEKSPDLTYYANRGPNTIFLFLMTYFYCNAPSCLNTIALCFGSVIFIRPVSSG